MTLAPAWRSGERHEVELTYGGKPKVSVAPPWFDGFVWEDSSQGGGRPGQDEAEGAIGACDDGVEESAAGARIERESGRAEHRLRYARDLVRGREESRMSGRPSERVGIAVVGLPTDRSDLHAKDAPSCPAWPRSNAFPISVGAALTNRRPDVANPVDLSISGSAIRDSKRRSREDHGLVFTAGGYGG